MPRKLDLHIHSKDCSDGKMPLVKIFGHARQMNMGLISITDHDSIDCQGAAGTLARKHGIHYLTGVELNISFSHPDYRNGKPVSLDLLGYQYDASDPRLLKKLSELREYRKIRAEKILQNLNYEFAKENLQLFTSKDLEAIEATVDGAFGRPHIANYMVEKGIVTSRQEAFDNYLVRCNVPKMPVTLEEASALIRGAGGKVVLAHPNDPNGTSLASLTKSIAEQQQIIRESMLPHLDGIECWHSRHDQKTVSAYLDFARKEALIVTGGSDCHQQPLILGTIDVPQYVADQFGVGLGDAFID